LTINELAERIKGRPQLENALRLASADEQIVLLKENFPDITDDHLMALQAEAAGQEGQTLGAGGEGSLISNLADSIGSYIHRDNSGR
jgi:hypothetical protein